MLRGRFKTEQISLMHILSLWKVAYDAWEWFRDYPRLGFHKAKLHIASFQVFMEKQENGYSSWSCLLPWILCPCSWKWLAIWWHCLKERAIACCPNYPNNIGPQVFYFLFNGGSARPAQSTHLGWQELWERSFFLVVYHLPTLMGGCHVGR